MSRLTWAALLLPIALGAQDGAATPAETRNPPPTNPDDRPDQSRRPSTPSTLHRAWMVEILDLDSRRASDLYAEVASDARPGQLLRWVAAARLAELQRLDISPATRVDNSDAPAVLRPRLAEFDTTLDLPSLVQRLSRDPEQVLAELATDDGQLPPLRPLVAATEDWLIDQIGPSRLDRIRRRFAAYTRRSFSDRVFAVRVLAAELQGYLAQADELRSIYFTQWQPPKVASDHELNLTRFRHHIEVLLGEREWTSYMRDRHRRLQALVEQTAATDPAAAVALLRRLPYYAGRLLAPLSEGGR